MSREFWNEFLQLYKSFPCLWDTKNPSYVKRELKREAYDILLSKIHEIDTSASLDTVKKKIDSFRTAFRREEKKVMSSMQSGAGEDEIYTPTLWYYRDLEEFLGNIPDESRKRFILSDSLHSEDDALMPVETLEALSEDSDYNYQPTPPSRKRKSQPEKRAELPRIFTQPFSGPEVEVKDDCSTFAANLELQMREITTEQKYIAQKLISDVMFLARTKRLNFNSSVNSNAPNNSTVQSKTVPIMLTSDLILPNKSEDPIS